MHFFNFFLYNIWILLKKKLKSSLPQKNFFLLIFDFDKESQNEILNCLQYVLLALIPTVILNKIIQKIIPPTTEDKGTGKF